MVLDISKEIRQSLRDEEKYQPIRRNQNDKHDKERDIVTINEKEVLKPISEN